MIRLNRERRGSLGPPADGGGIVPEIPFGVFLAPAAVIALVWGGAIIDWYLNRMVNYG